MHDASNVADILITGLRDPARTLEFGNREWDVFLRVARVEGLLAHLAWQFEQTGVFSQLPTQVQDILVGAMAVTDDQERMLRWEVDRISHALRYMDTPIVFLKGAAYCIAGLPIAKGRLVSDVDVLVPRAALPAVEAALTSQGWAAVKLDPYDQLYYREWMHELPPMRHPVRNTIVDVHHTILPLTSGPRPDPERLLEAARPLDATRLKVLAPDDMVIHSATHLFHDGALERGLRDLVDIDGLVREFASVPGFWQDLVPRAKQLELARPLFYALRYCQRLLGTAVPADVWDAVRGDAPSPPVLWAMDVLIGSALTPQRPDRRASVLVGFARWILYVRSHYLRMPMRLLIPHLLRKANTRRAAHRDAALP